MKTRFTLLFLVATFIAFAQTVTRGPYLQTPTSNSIIVMWNTSANSASKVWYGADPNNLTNEVSLNTNTRKHTVEITGLDPYTKYYYAVGYGSTILAGQDQNHHFKTNPLIGEELPIRVWAIGDFGKGNTEQIDVKQSYVNYTGNRHTDVWMWLGDNVYDNGRDSEYQNKVFGLTGFSDIFSWLPFWPSPGNHDYMEVWSQSTLFGVPYTNISLESHRGPYYEIVDVPEQAEAGGYPSQLEVFYSFDYGNVHFMSLNSEVFDFTLSYDGINRMKSWIEQDLQQNTQTFTIAYFHQPPYSKGSHDSDDAYELVMKAMREKVIPLLEDFDIDMVVCGHSHVFERSYLINGHYGNTGSFNPNTMIKNNTNGNFAQGNAYIKDPNSPTSDGTVYVVCGNSGSKTTSSALNHPAMYYSDGGTNEVGSFVMDIYKNRLDGKYLKSDGNIYDEFTILKKNLKLNPIADQVICEGGSVTLFAPISGGSDSLVFDWSPSASTDNFAVLNPTQNESYTLTVTDLLTGQVETRSFNVVVTQIPNPQITQSNDTLYTQSGFNYQWYLDGQAIAGATGDYIIPQTQGEYTVAITNGGCQSQSPNYMFYKIMLSSINDAIICEGESVTVNASYTGGSGNLVFDWTPSPESGTSATLSPDQTTPYTFSITDQTSGEVVSADFTIYVNTPIVPLIEQTGNLLRVQSGYTYQWYFNNQPIQGATLSYVSAQADGNYSVRITNGTCQSMSDEYYFEYNPLSVQQIGKSEFNVFPNPAKEQIVVKVDEEWVGAQYKILDTSGRVVLKGKLTNTSTEINIAKLATSTYILALDKNKQVSQINFTKE
jgi:acid phosphatase type 7